MTREDVLEGLRLIQKVIDTASDTLTNNGGPQAVDLVVYAFGTIGWKMSQVVTMHAAERAGLAIPEEHLNAS